MLRTIGPFVVGRETEIASSSEGGKTSQLLCAEIDTITNSIYDSFGTLIWLEVEDQEPQIIGRYSYPAHLFIPAKETP
jgi:hypothetical protein